MALSRCSKLLAPRVAQDARHRDGSDPGERSDALGQVERRVQPILWGWMTFRHRTAPLCWAVGRAPFREALGPPHRLNL
jgi:hypothetical protein